MDSILSNIEQVLFFIFFFKYQNYLCALSHDLHLSDCAIARTLIALSGITARKANVKKYVSDLRARYSKIKRNVNGEARVHQLSSLEDTEFTLLRTRTLKTPDTLRKKLRAELS